MGGKLSCTEDSWKLPSISEADAREDIKAMVTLAVRPRGPCGLRPILIAPFISLPPGHDDGGQPIGTYSPPQSATDATLANFEPNCARS